MLNNPEINNFYLGKLNAHGASAEGVGWKDSSAQLIRFVQLLKIINLDGPFSINDLGCGTGEIIKMLDSGWKGKYRYFGYDPLDEMIDQARKQFPENNAVKFFRLDRYQQMGKSDYTISSGIFNVKNNIDEPSWRKFILETIQAMSEASTRGFAFNALTTYSDKEFMKPDLFYSDPRELFDYCKKNFSRNVALLHDYELYDFTILVRK